jgi:hypothetical protein
LIGHDANTVQELGWSGVQNGALVRRAAGEGFGVFLTADKSIEFQRSVGDLAIAIIALRPRSNDIVDLEPLIAEVLTVSPTIRAGQIIRVPAATRQRSLHLSDLSSACFARFCSTRSQVNWGVGRQHASPDTKQCHLTSTRV